MNVVRDANCFSELYTIDILNWQGHIRSGQGCLSVLLCCFSLRVRPAHVVQASCRLLKRPLLGTSTQQVRFRHFQGSGMWRAELTPIGEDAENAGIRPLEACIPLSIQGIQYKKRLLFRRPSWRKGVISYIRSLGERIIYLRYAIHLRAMISMEYGERGLYHIFTKRNI